MNTKFDKEASHNSCDKDWVSVSSDHHLLFVQPDSLAHREIEYLIGVHEEAYKKFMTTFGLQLQNDQFPCYVKDRNKPGEHGGGYYIVKDRTIHVIYNEERKESYRGPHELCHAIVHKYIGEDIPRSLDEGIAEVLTKPLKRSIEFYCAELMLSNHFLPILELMDDATFTKHCPSDLYAQSMGFVGYLIDQYSWDKFVDLLRLTSQASSEFRSAIVQVYNRPLETIEEEWRTLITCYLKSNEHTVRNGHHWLSSQRNRYYKRYADAIVDIEICLNEERTPGVLLLAGEINFDAGNYDIALKLFLDAVASPMVDLQKGWFYRIGYLSIGKLYDLSGKRDLAIHYYHQVLSLMEYDDAHQEARRYLKDPYR